MNDHPEALFDDATWFYAFDGACMFVGRLARHNDVITCKPAVLFPCYVRAAVPVVSAGRVGSLATFLPAHAQYGLSEPTPVRIDAPVVPVLTLPMADRRALALEIGKVDVAASAARSGVLLAGG